jgi:hypothetical protein
MAAGACGTIEEPGRSSGLGFARRLIEPVGPEELPGFGVRVGAGRSRPVEAG